MSDLSKEIVKILSNESVREAFTACPTVADTVKLLAEHGVETTENELCEVLAQMFKSASGELSEENLEQVAGGFQTATLPPAVMADITAKMAARFFECNTGTSISAI